MPANSGDTNSILELGRSPRVGNGHPFQHSCLGNSMDRGAWQVTVHGVAKSRTRLSEHKKKWNSWKTADIEFDLILSESKAYALTRSRCISYVRSDDITWSSAHMCNTLPSVTASIRLQEVKLTIGNVVSNRSKLEK